MTASDIHPPKRWDDLDEDVKQEIIQQARDRLMWKRLFAMMFGRFKVVGVIAGILLSLIALWNVASEGVLEWISNSNAR